MEYRDALFPVSVPWKTHTKLKKKLFHTIIYEYTFSPYCRVIKIRVIREFTVLRSGVHIRAFTSTSSEVGLSPISIIRP